MAHDHTAALGDLATQFWKLAESLAARIAADGERGSDGASLRYARGRLEAILGGAGMELRTYDGQPWDATLPPLAINAEEMPAGAAARVERTIEPTILHGGTVMLPGRVMLEQA